MNLKDLVIELELKENALTDEELNLLEHALVVNYLQNSENITEALDTIIDLYDNEISLTENLLNESIMGNIKNAVKGGTKKLKGGLKAVQKLLTIDSDQSSLFKHIKFLLKLSEVSKIKKSFMDIMTKENPEFDFFDPTNDITYKDNADYQNLKNSLSKTGISMETITKFRDNLSTKDEYVNMVKKAICYVDVYAIGLEHKAEIYGGKIADILGMTNLKKKLTAGKCHHIVMGGHDEHKEKTDNDEGLGLFGGLYSLAKKLKDKIVTSIEGDDKEKALAAVNNLVAALPGPTPKTFANTGAEAPSAI